MPNLYAITIPGLCMKTDYPAVRHRLLGDFARVLDVLAMTTPATVLVVYRGQDEIDAWLDALNDSVATRRMNVAGDRGRDGLAERTVDHGLTAYAGCALNSCGRTEPQWLRRFTQQRPRSPADGPKVTA